MEGITRDGIGVFGWVGSGDEKGHDRRGIGRGVVGIAGQGTGVEGAECAKDCGKDSKQ